MFPRLWLPQARSHIIALLLRNTFLIVALPALYFLLPLLVGLGHGFLRDSGLLPTQFDEGVFANQWRIIILTAIFTFVAIEVQGYYLRRRRAEPFVNPPFQALIAELARRADLPYTPAIIFIPEGPVNAAATQSIFFGGKVLVLGDILKRIDEGETRAVFAHEIAHL